MPGIGDCGWRRRGCGLPTGQNTHEIAQAVHPDCRVVYADADPVVISHAPVLPRGPGVTAIRGDMAEPGAILADLRARRLINLAEHANPIRRTTPMILKAVHRVHARAASTL